MNLKSIIRNCQIIGMGDDQSTRTKLAMIVLRGRTGDVLDLKVDGIRLMCRDDEALHLIGEQLVTQDYPKIDIPDNATVLDIGANVGFYSIRMAKQFPKAKFICYEPDKKTFDVLLNNVLLNSKIGEDGYRMLQIDSINKAVWTHRGSIQLFKHDNLTHSLTIPSKITETVQTTSFDDCILAFNPWLVKMDVEGAEYEILMDSKMLPTIKVLMVEIHDSLGKKKKELIKHLNNKMRFVSEKNNVYHYTKKPII